VREDKPDDNAPEATEPHDDLEDGGHYERALRPPHDAQEFLQPQATRFFERTQPTRLVRQTATNVKASTADIPRGDRQCRCSGRRG
jgi:hypothetical protein